MRVRGEVMCGSATGPAAPGPDAGQRPSMQACIDELAALALFLPPKTTLDMAPAEIDWIPRHPFSAVDMDAAETAGGGARARSRCVTA